MKLLNLILLVAFGLTTQLAASDQRRSSSRGRNAVTPIVTGTVVVDDQIPTGRVVHAVPVIDRAAVQTAWEKDLYTYQLADLRRGLAGVSDADFPEFATLVSGQLITVTPNDDANSIAGYNAEILASFANLAKNRRGLLAVSVNKLCGGMDPDDKAESTKILSGMFSSATDEHLVVVDAMVEHVPAEMSGFEKKTLLKNLSKISADSFFAFCQIINKVLPVFYTPEHKKALYIRLSGMIGDKNKADFREVAQFSTDIFQAVEAHLRDGNLMIRFIISLINADSNLRDHFIEQFPKQDSDSQKALIYQMLK